MVPATDLLAVPLESPWHPEAPVPVCRAGQATLLLDHQRRPLDLCRQPMAGRLPRARQHELAAERSLDFRF